MYYHCRHSKILINLYNIYDYLIGHYYRPPHNTLILKYNQTIYKLYFLRPQNSQQYMLLNS